MFDLAALKLFTAIAVVATSVFAQSHSSEQSEAQITGAHYRRSLHPFSLFAKKKKLQRPKHRVHSIFLPARCPEYKQLPNDMAACDPPRERR
jgi:hypothetical protein